MRKFEDGYLFPTYKLSWDDLLGEWKKVGELRYLFRLLGASLMVDAGFRTIGRHYPFC